MKLILPAVLVLAAERATAFVPTTTSHISCSSLARATYAPIRASEKDSSADDVDTPSISTDTATAATTAAKEKESSSNSGSSAEKDIDWDGLFSAASAFGGALAKGVEAAAPVVGGAVVDAAFDVKNAATAAAKELNEQTAKNGGVKVKVPTISFGRKRSSFVDLSIPYDAACRLAYDQWKAQYRPEPRQDDPLSAEERYEQFRINYERTTIANVVAKKKVRDAGGFDEARTLKTVELDQYADYTDAEYTEAIRTPTWGEIFGDLADVATSVVSQSVQSASSESKAPKVKSPAPPKTKPLQFGKAPMAPRKVAAKPPTKPLTQKKTTPAFSMFGGARNGAQTKPKQMNGVAKKTTPATRTASQPKPLFGGARKASAPTTTGRSTSIFNGKAKPTAKNEVLTAKEAEFAKKIEASRAAKAKALAERKKKEEERRRKAMANFRG